MTSALAPDDRLELRDSGAATARCDLWWRDTPIVDGLRVGYVGAYERSDERAAHRMLGEARRRLRAAGCELAVGPVDGSTWHRYRFVTQRAAPSPFFLEPDNPPEYPDDFRRAGFGVFARYVSAEETPLDADDPRVARAAARLRAAGVTTRPFDVARFDDELEGMYDVALAAFARNVLFSPISREAFRDLYVPLRPLVDPAFVRVAEHGGRPVGFAFGVLDAGAATRDEAPSTLIGKTQARVPGALYAGLGAVMLTEVRQAARERGVTRLMHALIHERNIALNGTRRAATVVSSYAVFASALS